jgi:hypothetical protein
MNEGTCCNEHETISYARDQTGRIAKDTRLFVESMEGFSRNFRSLVERDHSLLNEWRLSFLRRFLDHGYADRYESGTRECWGHMRFVRSSTLCSLCSGQSGSFFDTRTNKAFMDLGACTTMLDRCSTFFVETNNLFEGFDKVAEYVKQYVHNHHLTRWADYFAGLHRAKRGLPEAIQRYVDTLSTYGDDKLRAQVMLCDRVFIIYELAVLYRMRMQMQVLAGFFNDIFESFRQARSIESPGRRLFRGSTSRTLEVSYSNSRATMN